MNSNLQKARKQKNDEFYTRLEDIENELKHYRPHFKGKVVLCNCDNPEWSNFWKYFHLNFEFLGLKKLISTHYNMDGSSSYKLEYDGGNDRDCTVGVKTELKGNGDFRSEECLEILKSADIVVTNPPFSRFITNANGYGFIETLVDYDKKFLIIGNKNAITYKAFFSLLRDNKVWLGYTSPNEFNTPNGKTEKINGLCRWFTNLDIQKRHEDIILFKHYNPKEYPKYDNYNAINVDKVSDIPCDYDGVMGVPITFLDKYNPEQFEIVAFRKGEDGKDLVFTREKEREFNHTFVSLYDFDTSDDKKCRRENQWKTYLCENNDKEKVKEPIDFFFPLSISGRSAGTMNGLLSGKETYRRVLIRKK